MLTLAEEGKQAIHDFWKDNHLWGEILVDSPNALDTVIADLVLQTIRKEPLCTEIPALYSKHNTNQKLYIETEWVSYET